MSQSQDVVIITGSSGLLGSRIAAALGDQYRVVGLDIEEPDDAGALERFIKTDLTDDDNVSDVLKQVSEISGGKLASAIHLAAYYDFSGEPSPMYEKLTVEGTRRLMCGLRERLDRVQQVVFSSSLLAMKPVDSPDQTLDEESPVQAEWEYPQSKLDAERVLREQRGDIPAVVLRLAGAYDEDGNSPPIGQQIKRIYQKDLESFVFPGDARRGQSFVHLDDVVRCFVQTVEHRGDLSDWEVFLIGEPDVVSYGTLQDRIGEVIHGKQWPTIRVPKAMAKAGAWTKENVLGQEGFIKPWMVDIADAHYPVDITKAREKLRWEPKRRLRDVIDEMARRMKRDPEAWLKRNGLVDEDEAS